MRSPIRASDDRVDLSKAIVADLSLLDGLCAQLVRKCKSVRQLKLFVETLLFRRVGETAPPASWYPGQSTKLVQDALPQLRATGVRLEAAATILGLDPHTVCVLTF